MTRRLTANAADSKPHFKRLATNSYTPTAWARPRHFEFVARKNSLKQQVARLRILDSE